MATPEIHAPHQNSQPPKNEPEAVIRALPRQAPGDGRRFVGIFLLCCGASGGIHVVLLSLFLFITVNATSANVTVTREIQTQIDEKPREENLTNEDIGTDPSEALNYNVARVEEVAMPGPANPTEDVGNSNVAESAPMNVPPPPGFGAEGQGGGVKTPNVGLMNPSDITGGMMKGLFQPGGIGGRSGSTRQQLVNEGGGNTASEAAVARGIKWLVQHQAPDGHWSLDGFNQHGRCNCRGFGQSNDIAATAFGLLPLLGAGETHRKKDGVYSKNVERALTYLMLKQSRDGNFGGGMYAHGLATIAMCEAYGLTSDPKLKSSAQRAINFIRSAQSESGGWRYEPRSGGDTSVVGWQVMALKSGQMAGLEVDDSRNPTLAKASKFLKSCAVADESAYGYTGPDENSPTMTAVGLLCRLYLGTGVRNSGILGGVNRLKQTAPPGSLNSLYYYYYATQVMHHVGGPAWETWNPKMRDLLISKQDKGTTPGRKHQAGSWSPGGDAHAGAGGRIMITSLSILTLEVYYRHLPLYRRNMGDKAMASN
jgi:hypothetical protein